MDTGSQTDSAETIDQLHAKIIAGAAETPAASPVVEAGNPAPDATAPCLDPNAGFVEEMLATCCRWYAKSVYKEFYDPLEPLAGHEQAHRIADRAKPSDEMQEAVCKAASRILAKYGVAKYVSDEAMLIATILMYVMELREARKDRDAILNAHKKPVPMPPQDKAADTAQEPELKKAA